MNPSRSVRHRVRRNDSRRHRPAAEILEDRTLLSSVTADAFTIVGGSNVGQQSILHNRDWDADAAPEWVAQFEGQRVAQTAGIDQRFVADDWVPVDVSKTYGLSGWARSGDNFGMRFSSLNQQSFGIEEFDADYLRIESIHVLKYGTAADTTLRAALNPGDTQILLNSAAGWSTSGDVSTRALAWYGYANKAGTTYANYTYTRNVATGGASGLWSPGGVNVAARVITLNGPWSGPAIPAGTAIRNATSGADHSTMVLNRQNVAGDFTPSEHAAIIGGGTAVNGSFAANRFAPGTAYVRPVILANQHGQTNNFMTWQDVRIQQLPSGAVVQDAKLPVIDLSTNPSGNQTVTLPFFARGDSFYHVGAEARIKVSQNERYRLSIDSLDYSEEDLHPVGFYSFDADGKLIHSLHVTRHTGAVDTRLARAVQPGDTAIYVNDATGWSNAIGNTAESRSLAWYGYRDTSGTLYPDYTYTRNVAFDFMDGLWDVGGITFDTGVGAYKITLRSAWAGMSIASGTAVRNATGHDEIQLLDIPTDRFFGWNEYDNIDWYKYSTVIGGGVWQNGNVAETAFRPGTRYVQPALKAVTPHRYAVHFGPESDQGLNQKVRLPTFEDQTLVTLNRSRQWIQSDDLLPVSPSLTTTISMDATFGTVMNSGQTSSERHSIGFVPHDADGMAIESLHVARYATAVDTTLAATLNPGATQIVLTSAAGWSNVDVAGTRAISWYGYRDATGTLYPDYSYTRNVAADLVNGLWDPGGISGNVITLRQPWAGPALAAGTAVRNAVDGDSLIPAVLDQGTLPNAWTKLSATISGTWTNGLRSSLALPQGTSSIRIAARANELNFTADATIRLRNVRMVGSTGATGTLQANNVTVVNLDVLANDAAAASPVQITSAAGAKFGTVQILAGAGIGGRDLVRYTSQSWFAGTDQFTYTVRNTATGEIWTTTATVTITADNLANDASRAASIAGQVNNPASHSAPPISRKPGFPLADQVSLYDVEQGQTLVANDLPLLSLKQSATDADNDVMAYRLISGVSHGTMLLRADGTFEYTPEPGFVGWDSFEYTVTDGLSEFTRTATVQTWKADERLLYNRMRNIMLAFHNFHDIHSRFSFSSSNSSTALYFNAAGNPYLSWRVHLLPLLGYAELYAKFRLSEPWNSANNLPLLSQMPNVFRSPGDTPTTTVTRFQTISDLQDLTTGKYFARRGFDYSQSNLLGFVRIADVTDDLLHSIMFVQTGSDVSVPWTAPQDVDHDPNNPYAPLGTLDNGRVSFVTIAGPYISLAVEDVPSSTFHALVTVSAGELVDGATLRRRDAELHSRPRLVNTGSALLGTANWTSTEEQLRAIGLAMHNYDSTYNGLPAQGDPNWFDVDGKPFHSWRVYLLPYLGYGNLFNQFHLNERWDSAHNLTLLDKMPDIFRSTGDSSASTTTRLQVFSGPDALFGRDTRFYSWANPPVQHVGPKIRDFVDGTRNTIMVAEVGADRAVPWTAPDDVIFDAANPLAALGTLSMGQLSVVLGDGSAMTLGADVLLRYLPALVSRDGREILDGYGLQRLEYERIGKIRGGGTGIKNQLREAALAFHNFHDTFSRFPSWDYFRNFYPDGRPYLSWRVYLLPMMEHSELFNQFHLDEPWDSPHNIQLLDEMPQFYRSRGDAWDSNTTRFQVFTGSQAPFQRFKDGSSSGSPYTYYLGPRIRDFTDGLSETFLAVEAGAEMAVPWTKPDDLEFNPLDPLGTMGLEPDDTFMALMADGSARVISASEVAAALSALITSKGGEVIYELAQNGGGILPGVSITGTKDNRLVITEGELGAIDVVLDKPGNVQIDVTLSIGGVVLSDKTTLTFTTANWNTPQAVTLKALNDDLIDGAQSVVMTLSVNDAATTSNEYDALANIVIPVFQVSDDVPTIMTTATGGISVTEGGAGQSVSVSLSHRPTSDVTLSVSVTDPLQMSSSKSSLVFTAANWNTPQAVIFTAVNDLLADGTAQTSVLFSITASNDAIFRRLTDSIIPASVIDNEIPDIQVSVTNGDTVVSEDGLTDSVTVRLSVQPIGDVIINVLPTDTTEVGVSSSQLTFTNANWNIAQTVTISGINDSLLDGDQLSSLQFSVASQSSTPYLTAVTKSVVVRTIDDEAAEIVIINADGIIDVSEAGSTDSFSVRLSLRPVGNVTVRMTPTAPTEASVQNSTLTFTPADWDQPQTVTVVGVDDAVADGLQFSAITVAIGAGSSAPYLLAAAVTVYVRTSDDEVPAIVVQQTLGSTVVNESANSDTFSVSLSHKPLGRVLVLVDSGNVGEATVSPGSLTFTAANWDQPQTVTVVGVDDIVADGDQVTAVTMSVAVGSSAPYLSAAAQTVNVRTIDNEVAAIVVQQTSGSTVVNESGTTDTLNVSLSSKPVGPVVILVSSGNIGEATVSPASLTFTSTNWNLPQTLTVTGVDDSVVDGDIISSLSMSVTPSSAGTYRTAATQSLSVKTTDDEIAGLIVTEPGGSTVVSESGSADTVAVRLTAQPIGDVIINVASLDTTEVGVSASLLTFTSTNWNVAQTIILSGVDDALVDGDQLSKVQFSVAPQSSAPYLTATAKSIAVRTTDDDLGGLVITETGGTTSVTESGSSDSFSVRLSVRPGGNVLVQIAPTATSEISVQNSTLTFTAANWDQPQTVTVAGVDDTVADGDQITALTVSIDARSSDSYPLAGVYSISVRTSDNEDASIVVQQTSGNTVVSESGTIDTVNVSLASRPVGPVVIQLSSSDTREAGLSPASLTFTSLNWNLAQTVTVTGMNDNVVDGDVISSVSLTPDPISAGSYGTAASGSVPVTTTDNEIADFIVTETEGSTTVSESSTTDTVDVRLTAQPTGIVVIKVMPADSTEAAVSPTTLTFDSSTWNIAQVVRITGVDDTLIDGRQTSIIRFEVDSASSQSQFAGLQRQISVQTMDDELVIPVVLSPKVSTISQQPVVVWTPVEGAAQYDLWIQNISTGQSPVIRTLVLGTSFTPVAPLGIGDYQVWVRAVSADDRKSPWSLPVKFWINTPALIQQMPKYVNSLLPTISWNVLPGAARYDLWVNNRLTGQFQVIRKTSLTTTSFTPAAALPMGSYIAWVRGIDVAGKPAGWSQPTEFYTAASPQTLSPLDPTFNQRPEFTWSAVPGAIGYDVALRDKSTRIETRVLDIPGTSWTPSIDLLKGPHEWWVRAKGPFGILGFWSNAAAFDVGGRPRLVPIGPSQDRTPLFQWTRVDGSVRYILQVDRIDQPKSRVIRHESLTTNQFTPTTDLAPGTYRAWVQAVSGTGAMSAWSVPIEFVISQIDPVDLPSMDLSNLLSNRLTRISAAHPSTAPHDMTTQPEPDNPEFIDLVFSQATEECRTLVDEWRLLCSNRSPGSETPQAWFE